MLIKQPKDEMSPCYVYEEGIPWNAVEKVIMERRSIRKFKNKTLPESLIKRILEAGRFAPSTGNQQPGDHCPNGKRRRYGG
ncbi:MAG: nitroreductase family protein [Proteobacteria bacterium]|nr:nitroreductase family protein [Pseudomonadota bacterium]